MIGIGRYGVAAAALALVLWAPAALAKPAPHTPAVALDLDIPGAEKARFRSPEAAEGVARLKAGDYPAAQTAFSAALRTDPQNAYLHFLNGLSYHLVARAGDESQRDLAETGYRQALQFDPNAWWAAYAMGLLDAERNDWRAAQRDFAKVLLVDRDNGGALHGLAVASYYIGDLPLADSTVQRALELRPTDRAVLRTAALVAAANGQPERAKAIAARYAAAEPQAFRRDHLEGRIADWSAFRVAAPSRLAGLGQSVADVTVVPPIGSPQAAPAPEVIDPTPHKQVVVDVVYIRTTDTLVSRQGVNLLRGLQMQYAYMDTRSRNTLPNTSDYQNQTGGPPQFPGIPFSRSVVQSLGIPAINYSLNIFNSQTARNDVVSRPTLIAQEGSSSVFFSGTQLSIALAGQYGGNLNQLEVGLRLEITPSLVTDKEVVLKVAVKRTSFDATVEGSFDQAVETSDNHVTATVTLSYDQTLILTGLTDREKTSATDRTPVLSDIPGLQYFFKQRSIADSSRSVLIMVTPHRSEAADPGSVETAEAAVAPEVAALRQQWAAEAGQHSRLQANLLTTFHYLRTNPLFRQLRAGDLSLEDWEQPDTLSRAIREDLHFLFF
jgi:general secretion pathway protein D